MYALDGCRDGWLVFGFFFFGAAGLIKGNHGQAPIHTVEDAVFFRGSSFAVHGEISAS